MRINLAIFFPLKIFLAYDVLYFIFSAYFYILNADKKNLSKVLFMLLLLKFQKFGNK